MEKVETIQEAWAKLKTATLNDGHTMAKNEERERRRMFFCGAVAAFINMLRISYYDEPEAKKLISDLAKELIDFELSVAVGLS